MQARLLHQARSFCSLASLTSWQALLRLHPTAAPISSNVNPRTLRNRARLAAVRVCGRCFMFELPIRSILVPRMSDLPVRFRFEMYFYRLHHFPVLFLPFFFGHCCSPCVVFVLALPARLRIFVPAIIEATPEAIIQVIVIVAITPRPIPLRVDREQGLAPARLGGRTCSQPSKVSVTFLAIFLAHDW